MRLKRKERAGEAAPEQQPEGLAEGSPAAGPTGSNAQESITTEGPASGEGGLAPLTGQAKRGWRPREWRHRASEDAALSPSSAESSAQDERPDAELDPERQEDLPEGPRRSRRWAARGWRRRETGQPQPEVELPIGAAAPATDQLDDPWLLDTQDDTPAVECSELVKRFGHDGEASVLALRGISLKFEPRTFSAIMGPSGAGKSTLMHLLAGLDAPTSGTVRIGGVSLEGLSDRKRTALRSARVGFVFQAFNLLPVLSAQENIELPLRVVGARVDPYWVEELLRAFDLSDRRSHRPAELSGGQQQRVAIARALVTQPNVVFADEPTGNIDSAAGEEVLGILETCVREYGQCVVMVTHDPLAAAHAERVVFLADGEIVRDDQAPTTRQILEVLRERS